MPTSPAPTFAATRLCKHSDYGLVYGASRKHQSSSLSYFYRDKASGDASCLRPSPRFGITVPRVLGPAVLRNRIKRRLRVAARTAIHLLPPGIDVVFHPRPVVATMPFPLLQRECEAVFTAVVRRLATGAPNTPLPRSPRRGGKPAPAAPPRVSLGKASAGKQPV